MDTPSGAKPEGVCAHFPTKSGLTGGAKQCIVQKIKVAAVLVGQNRVDIQNHVALLQNGDKRAIL
jgi:hypothetical protein